MTGYDRNVDGADMVLLDCLSVIDVSEPQGTHIPLHVFDSFHISVSVHRTTSLNTTLQMLSSVLTLTLLVLHL